MSEDTVATPKKKKRKPKRRRTPDLGERVVKALTHPAVLTAVLQCVKELTPSKRR